MTDGDQSHSEFTFTGYVLAGSFPACIGFIGFVIILQSGVPHAGGHRASRIFFSDVTLVGCPFGLFPADWGDAYMNVHASDHLLKHRRQSG